MRTAVIVDAVRTPIGRAHSEKGVYRNIRGDELAAACVRALVSRNGVPLDEIADVIFGCSQQTGEQGVNVARLVSLLAGLHYSTGGTTVNRLCGSGMQALHQGAHAIIAGAEDVHIVGGVEHMQHLPLGNGLDINPKLFQRTSRGTFQMGLTAEHVAQRQNISREAQDQFALRSHQLAVAAREQGKFKNEIIPVFGHDEQGRRTLVDVDQCVRADTSLTRLAALPPAFVSNGTVTAGNSSPLNDGAAALLVMSEAKAKALGLKPLARIHATAVVGIEPALMGLGPVPATNKVLQRAGLTLDNIDLIELNEAFAAQALACLDQLGLSSDAAKERVNIQGGAIALGHPIGASGARIVATLVHALHARDAQWGLATMCIGLGQGIATIVERI